MKRSHQGLDKKKEKENKKENKCDCHCAGQRPPLGILIWWELRGRVSLFSLRGAEDAERTNERRRETEGVGVPASAQ